MKPCRCWRFAEGLRGLPGAKPSRDTDDRYRLIPTGLAFPDNVSGAKSNNFNPIN